MIHRIRLFIKYMLNVSVSNVKDKKKRGMDKTEDKEGGR